MEKHWYLDNDGFRYFSCYLRLLLFLEEKGRIFTVHGYQISRVYIGHYWYSWYGVKRFINQILYTYIDKIKRQRRKSERRFKKEAKKFTILREAGSSLTPLDNFFPHF